MMNYQEITNLYRQIGRMLHEMHAENVYLINSRMQKEGKYDIVLEFIVEGHIHADEAENICASRWPNAQIHIWVADMEEHRIADYIEDAIQL